NWPTGRNGFYMENFAPYRAIMFSRNGANPENRFTVDSDEFKFEFLKTAAANHSEVIKIDPATGEIRRGTVSGGINADFFNRLAAPLLPNGTASDLTDIVHRQGKVGLNSSIIANQLSYWNTLSSSINIGLHVRDGIIFGQANVNDDFTNPGYIGSSSIHRNKVIFGSTPTNINHGFPTVTICRDVVNLTQNPFAEFGNSGVDIFSGIDSTQAVNIIAYRGTSGGQTFTSAFAATNGITNGTQAQRAVNKIQNGWNLVKSEYNLGISPSRPHTTFAAQNDWELVEVMQDGTLSVVSNGVGALSINNPSGYTAPGSGIYMNSSTAQKIGGGSWTVFSDKRLKDEIQPYKSGLDIIKQINPITYKYTKKSNKELVEEGLLEKCVIENSDGEYDELKASLCAINSDKVHVGVIAQEVKEVLPLTVTEDKCGVLQFDNSELVYTLINAVKELSEQVDYLKSVVSSSTATEKQTNQKTNKKR
ncbi:MAG: tail fiber domain-containing protein, partial [Waterburya sp.]